MNDILLRAIQAMDAYNQGYNKGVNGVGDQIGTATKSQESEINPGTTGVSAGFYAVAYTLADGSMVISYRGTDDPVADAIYGYGLPLLGTPDSLQTNMAIKFYQQVAASLGSTPHAANVTLWEVASPVTWPRSTVRLPRSSTMRCSNWPPPTTMLRFSHTRGRHENCLCHFADYLWGAFLWTCMPVFDQVAVVRFRITIDVETPEGVKFGSGVIENRRIKPTWDFKPYHDDVTGEAIEVDLGERGSLFLLVEQAQPFSIILYRAYHDADLLPPSMGDIEVQRYIAKLRQPVEIKFKEMSIFSVVRFPDRSNPQSVEKAALGDLRTTFGNGVQLKRIVVVPTDEQISTGIETRLPWLSSLIARSQYTHIDGTEGSTSGSDPLSKTLSVHYFKRSQ